MTKTKTSNWGISPFCFVVNGTHLNSTVWIFVALVKCTGCPKKNVRWENVKCHKTTVNWHEIKDPPHLKRNSDQVCDKRGSEDHHQYKRSLCKKLVKFHSIFYS